MYFFNNQENRKIVKETADEYDLYLVDPDIFLDFINDNYGVQTWDDVKREMVKKGSEYFSMTVLQRQYKWCGYYLYSKGYTDIDRSKIAF